MKRWWPNGSPRQFRLEKWWWAFFGAPCLAWQVFLPASWGKWGSQLIVQLSIYSLVKGAGGQEQAASARAAAEASDE